MAPPKLTEEERALALEKAKAARAARAAVKADLRSGKLRIEDVIDTDDEALKRMRVRDLLLTVSHMGPIRTQQFMFENRIAESRRIGGLGHLQKAAILKAFSD